MNLETPEQSVAPTTTTQEDLTVAGQRRVNLIWEYTQALIAISVTEITVFTVAVVGVGLVKVDQNGLIALMQLVGMTLLILGFYFSRTNHQAIGGVGSKANEQQDYKGR